MAATESSRVSVPLHGGGAKADEEALTRHSFDLVLFPGYLARKVAPKVRVEVSARPSRGTDVAGWFTDASGAVVWKYASLVADDDDGCLTDSDDLYRTVHGAFESASEEREYVGFFRFGTPPYAPMFAVAMMYRKFGRGLYRAGEYLPVPWRQLPTNYAFELI